MRQARALVLVPCAALAVAAALWRTRAPTERPIPEAAATPTAPPTPEPTRPSTPPSPARGPGVSSDVRAALARVFGKALSEEGGAFAVGDLNGDGVPDVAIAARPAPDALADLNAELANWILQEPVEPPTAASGRPHLTPRPDPVRVEGGDLLLAVIHGFGPTGWRNPEARQTYLLRRAVDPGTPLRVEAGRGLAPDVLAATRDGRPVRIYWTGARYALRSSPPVKR